MNKAIEIGTGINDFSGAKSYKQILQDGNTIGWYDETTISKNGSNVLTKWANKLGVIASDFTSILGTPMVSTDGVLLDGVNGSFKTGVLTYNGGTSIYLVLRQVTWKDSSFIFEGLNAASGSMYQGGSSPSLRISSIRK